MSSPPPTLVILLLLFIVPVLAIAPGPQGLGFPGGIPLAVRSPYLNSWLPVTTGIAADKLYSASSDLSHALGWCVLANVDNTTYNVFGQSGQPFIIVNLTNIAVTPTQTVITTQAGPIQLNLTFLNPIEPGDFVKQSIPFSYLSLTATSLDNSAHKVQVYSDVTGEWASGDRTQYIQWNVTSNTNVMYHSVALWNPIEFSEVGVQAAWGTMYYAMKSGNNTTYKISNSTTARILFGSNGTLDNQVNATIDLISDLPVFAISSDLGTIQATQAPVVWAIGYTTDPAISYTDQLDSPPEKRSAYYKQQYTNDSSLIVDFLNDFSNASSRAHQLDLKILHDAANVSNFLGDLVSTAVAQVYGSTQLTIGTDINGNFNESDVLMFMKNIGGSETNRINPVETLYAAFPALMYIDPTLGPPLLEPLFRLQAPPNYSILFAASDLGSNYPNITGSKSVHNQEVEQSGNMLIMTYAHARATGDGNLISRYYRLLSSWANYLTNTLLFIHDQASADGWTATNQTNLAIKGIIAIQAMSEMSIIVDRVPDARKYSNTAAQLYSQWKSMALGNDGHILAIYNQPSSWTLGYNLFADAWLGTKVVESSIYSNHGIYINSNLLSDLNNSRFGLPVDSSNTPTAVSSWDLFVAAMTSDNDLRSNLIQRIYNRSHFFTPTIATTFPLVYNSANASFVQRPFPPGYNGSFGSDALGMFSPAQGAMFAPLARNAPVFSIPVNNSTTPGTTASAKSLAAKTAAIVAGLVASFILIGLIAFIWRRRSRKMRKSVEPLPPPDPNEQMRITPFNWSRGRTQRELSQVPPSGSADAVALTADANGSASSPPESSYTPSLLPPPAGLSSKELARMRAETLPQRQTSAYVESSEPQHEAESVGTSGQAPMVPPSETPGLRTVVESLQREVQLLRAERFDVPPPSYTDGGE